MVYEISPSTLKAGLPSNRFSCARCFWLKVVKGIRQPDMSGLGKIHHDIHDWIYEYLKQQWIAILPRGRLIETELKIKARPVHGVQLWGYLDALIQLDDGGYAIMDLKTTTNTKWVVKNYALQVNVYRHCLENAEESYPDYAPIKRLGLLTFSGYRFGVNSPQTAGIVGSLHWHEVTKDERMVGKAIGEVLPVLRSETPPSSSEDCEWCRDAKLRGDLSQCRILTSC